MKLRWEKFGNGRLAMIGDIAIGYVTPLSADPDTWAYKVDGIRVKGISRAVGHVKGQASARRAVERAWARWAECAGMTK